MRTLEAEHVVGGGARSRELPAAAVGELEARARIGAGARAHVPLVGDRDLFREGESHRPAGQRGGAGVGDAHVQLELISTAGLRRRTTVRRECLPV
jgi:hypothetical protein